VPIPSNQQIHFELLIAGTVASAGSSARTFLNVHHVRRTSTVNPVSKGNIIAAYQTSIRTLLLTCLSLRLTLSSFQCRCVDDAQDAYASVADVHAGLVTGDSMPLTQAAFLLLQTGLRGRSYRGSKHLFPLGESATTVLTDDIFNAGALTYLGNYAAALLAGFTDANGNVWVPQVLSRKLSQLKVNPTTVTANDVTSIAVGKRVGVMRHRHVKSLY
jgi:hypothetical protein